MRKHLLYMKYVVKHKWYVFWECFWLANYLSDTGKWLLCFALLWRGIKHDWTMFLPSEWSPYVEYFYGEKVAHPTTKVLREGQFVPLMEHPEHVKQAFDRAWNYHQKRHDHHWQFWLLSPDNPRPNFNEQSYDGGMTVSTISDTKKGMGRDAALVICNELTWWKPDFEAVKELDRDLKNTPVPLDMPEICRWEMLADWRGAGKALGKPKTWEWYEANKGNMFLHPDVRNWVEKEMQSQKEIHRVGVMLGFELP